MQRNTFEFVEYCKTRSEINFWYENPSVEVMFCCYITEKIVQLTLRSTTDNLKKSRRTHIVNGKFKISFSVNNLRHSCSFSNKNIFVPRFINLCVRLHRTRQSYANSPKGGKHRDYILVRFSTKNHCSYLIFFFSFFSDKDSVKNHSTLFQSTLP